MIPLCGLRSAEERGGIILSKWIFDSYDSFGDGDPSGVLAPIRWTYLIWTVRHPLNGSHHQKKPSAGESRPLLRTRNTNSKGRRRDS